MEETHSIRTRDNLAHSWVTHHHLLLGSILHCKILHWGRFCSRDQTHLECGCKLIKLLTQNLEKIHSFFLSVRILPLHLSEAQKMAAV